MSSCYDVNLGKLISVIYESDDRICHFHDVLHLNVSFCNLDNLTKDATLSQVQKIDTASLQTAWKDFINVSLFGGLNFRFGLTITSYDHYDKTCNLEMCMLPNALRLEPIKL